VYEERALLSGPFQRKHASLMLYEAAQSMLRSKKWSWLKAWAMQIARRRGMKKAIVALTRAKHAARLG
jgi:hypothetical protein